MKAVISSTLEAVNYNETTSILTIKFHNGEKHEYYSVPDYIYDSLVNARSKSKFYKQNIKNVYQSDQVV